MVRTPSFRAYLSTALFFSSFAQVSTSQPYHSAFQLQQLAQSACIDAEATCSTTLLPSGGIGGAISVWNNIFLQVHRQSSEQAFKDYLGDIGLGYRMNRQDRYLIGVGLSANVAYWKTPVTGYQLSFDGLKKHYQCAFVLYAPTDYWKPKLSEIDLNRFKFEFFPHHFLGTRKLTTPYLTLQDPVIDLDFTSIRLRHLSIENWVVGIKATQPLGRLGWYLNIGIYRNGKEAFSLPKEWRQWAFKLCVSNHRAPIYAFDTASELAQARISPLLKLSTIPIPNRGTLPALDRTQSTASEKKGKPQSEATVPVASTPVESHPASENVTGAASEAPVQTAQQEIRSGKKIASPPHQRSTAVNPTFGRKPDINGPHQNLPMLMNRPIIFGPPRSQNQLLFFSYANSRATINGAIDIRHPMIQQTIQRYFSLQRIQKELDAGKKIASIPHKRSTAVNPTFRRKPDINGPHQNLPMLMDRPTVFEPPRSQNQLLFFSYPNSRATINGAIDIGHPMIQQEIQRYCSLQRIQKELDARKNRFSSFEERLHLPKMDLCAHFTWQWALSSERWLNQPLQSQFIVYAQRDPQKTVQDNPVYQIIQTSVPNRNLARRTDQPAAMGCSGNTLSESSERSAEETDEYTKKRLSRSVESMTKIEKYGITAVPHRSRNEGYDADNQSTQSAPDSDTPLNDGDVNCFSTQENSDTHSSDGRQMPTLNLNFHKNPRARKTCVQRLNMRVYQDLVDWTAEADEPCPGKPADHFLDPTAASGVNDSEPLRVKKLLNGLIKLAGF